MTCENSQENLSAMVDGELPDKDLAPTLAHTATCSQCRGFLTVLTRQPALLRSASPGSVPPGLDRRVDELARFDGSRPQGAPQEMFWHMLTARIRVPAPVAFGAAVLLVGLITLSAVAWRALQREEAQATRVVYMMEFPPVEVIASPPTSHVVAQ